MEKIYKQEQCIEGRIVEYFCSHKQKPVRAEILGLLDSTSSILIVRRLDEEMADLIDYMTTEVYLVEAKVDHSVACECGSAHTSRPSFHLAWCPMVKVS